MNILADFFQEKEVLNISFTFAVGYKTAIIIHTDDEVLIRDIDAIGNSLDDLGISFPDEHGIYQWIGTITQRSNNTDPIYEGDWSLIQDLNGPWST